MESLKKYVTNLALAKENLKEAQLALSGAEVALYNHVKDKLPEKATTHFDGIKIVTGFYDHWDSKALDTVLKNWEYYIPFPFKTVYKPDAKAVNYLRDNAPAVYAVFSDALTLTPKKPAFLLKNEEE